jgi:hypothetical protein
MGYDHLIELLRFFEKPTPRKDKATRGKPGRKTVRRPTAAKKKAAKKR